jgi:hypothetical protein
MTFDIGLCILLMGPFQSRGFVLEAYVFTGIYFPGLTHWSGVTEPLQLYHPDSASALRAPLPDVVPPLPPPPP